MKVEKVDVKVGEFHTKEIESKALVSPDQTRRDVHMS